MSLHRKVGGLILRVGGLISLNLCVLPCGFPILAVAQSPPPPIVQGGVTHALDARKTGAAAGGRQPDRQPSGSISGTVTDRFGTVAVGAQVRLTREDQPAIQEVLSGDNGQFSFADLPAGPFQLTIKAGGFETQRVSGVLLTGQAYLVPEIRIVVATVVTEVRVGAGFAPGEVAHEQIKEQEKQRVLGFIPNFYVSYVPDAAPLAPKQKFELAWRSTIDPFTFVGVGILAGFQQATNAFRDTDKVHRVT